MNRALFALAAAVLVGLPSSAFAAGAAGDVVQSDTLGMNLVNYDGTAKSTKTVKDAAVLSEFIGLHYFVVDRVRLGMNFQFGEQLTPAPPPGNSRFAIFALLPQVGVDFYGPMFAALVYTFAPRTAGQGQLGMGFQGVLGAGVPVADGVKVTMAIEVPWNFLPHETIGLTPLLGVAIRL